MELSTKLSRLRMIFTTRRIAKDCGARTPKSVLDWQAAPGSIKVKNAVLINHMYRKYSPQIARHMKKIEHNQ